MKTSITKLKSSLFLLTLFTGVALAKPVAQVTGLSGSVFVITSQGKTHTLSMNDHLEHESEILVDEDATVVLNDYYDTSYSFTGGSHAKFYNKSIQLKKGKTWVKGQGNKHSLELITANGHVIYKHAEFIATFDQTSSKSQFLVVNGDIEVSNILNSELRYTAQAGTFSLIDPDQDNGIPRAPTKVGLSSLNNALAEFKSSPKASARTRSIASVPAKEKGEITFIRSSRMPASVKTVKKHKKASLSPVPIRVYGVSAPEKKRHPASVMPHKLPTRAPQSVKIDQEFYRSLKKEVAEQPKHSKELESLIEDLRSY
jgi:hypothetical protein